MTMTVRMWVSWADLDWTGTTGVSTEISEADGESTRTVAVSPGGSGILEVLTGVSEKDGLFGIVGTSGFSGPQKKSILWRPILQVFLFTLAGGFG